METNAIQIKKLETEIKQTEKTLKMDKEHLEFAEKSVNITSAKLSKQGIPTLTLKHIVDTGKIAYDETKDIAEKSKAMDEIGMQKIYCGASIDVFLSYIKDYVRYTNDVKQSEATLAKLKQDLESLKTKKEETKVTESSVPEVSGHLYPVKKVVEWTQKLDFWNAELDKFIEKIEKTDINIDITWLCKKCEWICRKINYALAVLRYEIIKVLGSLYKQVQDYLPMLEVVTKVPTLTTVVSWATGIIDLFLGPYKIIIQFIQDFMTYTPPLISSATSLVAKAASVPPLILSRVNIVAEDKTTGEQKEIAEVYKQYLKIEMEPITLADIMGGGEGAKKPAIAEFSGNKQQYALLENRMATVESQLEQLWETFKSEIAKTYNGTSKENLPNIRTKYPTKLNMMVKTKVNEGSDFIDFQAYYLAGEINSYLDESFTALKVYEMSKAEEKFNKAKAKAVKKAENAVAKAKKAKQAAAKREQAAAAHILDDKIIAEAEQAQREADMAQAEAEQALQEVNKEHFSFQIPWGKTFNSNQYPVYANITPRWFKEEVVDGGVYMSDLWDMVQMYYTQLESKKPSAKKLAKAALYIGFLKQFSSVYPYIDTFLKQAKTLISSQVQIAQEESELNKRSIFK